MPGPTDDARGDEQDAISAGNLQQSTNTLSVSGPIGETGAETRPYLLGTAGEHVGRSYPLHDTDELVIGRSSGCQVRTSLDDTVSSRHARIASGAGGGFRLLDLRSKNGTFVNGRRVDSIALRRGDRITLGESTAFRFDYLSEDEKRIWDSSVLDALTGLSDHAVFERSVRQLFQATAARGGSLSVVLLDVDGFRTVNDHHALQAGDAVLKGIAVALREHVASEQPDGIACRCGGDEFGILLPDCSESDAVGLADRLRARVAGTSFQHAEERVSRTLSLGVATAVPGGFDTVERLLAEADSRLQRARSLGGNRVVSS